MHTALGRYIAASQIEAGTITTGRGTDELKFSHRTETRRATFFNVLYPDKETS